MKFNLPPVDLPTANIIERIGSRSTDDDDVIEASSKADTLLSFIEGVLDAKYANNPQHSYRDFKKSQDKQQWYDLAFIVYKNAKQRVIWDTIGERLHHAS